MNLLAALPVWGIVLIVVAAVVALIIIGLVVSLILRDKRSDHAEAAQPAVTAAEEPKSAEPPSDSLRQSQPDVQPEEPAVREEPAVKPAATAEKKPAKKKPVQTDKPAEAEPAPEPAYEPYIVPKATATAKTSPIRKNTAESRPKGGEDAKMEENSMTQENQPTEGAQAAAEKAKPVTKTYHVSKRKTENKWQVKMAGGSRAIKMFITQAEAIDFAKKLAENQEAKIVIHKEDGSFRRLTYHKKK